MKNNYPTYIVKRQDYTIWKRYKDTNLYMYYIEKEIENRVPHDWWTYEVLTEKYGFMPIDDSQYNMYNTLHDQYCERIDKEIKANKGCSYEDECDY